MKELIFSFYAVCIMALFFAKKRKLAVVAVFLSLAHTAVFAVMGNDYTVSYFDIIFAGVFFLLYLLFLVCFEKKYLLSENESYLKVRQRKMELEELIKKDGELKKKNEKLEQDLSEVVKIYEYTKRLGSTMEFGEAVLIFGETLGALTHFKEGNLFLLKDNAVTKIYRISSGGIASLGDDFMAVSEYERNSVIEIINNPQMFIYENPNAFLAVPLMAENETLGVVTLKNVPMSNIDRIHFIAIQFALEIRKTRLYEKIKELSIIDSLTQLYLRRHFVRLLEDEIERCQRLDQPLTIALADVDYFKKVNDEYGHLAGDLVLKKIAGTLKEKLREIDVLCRYGGDEFMIALPKTNSSDALGVAERLRKAVSENIYDISGEKFQVTVSIGISSCHGKNGGQKVAFSELIEQADKALYQAKSQGRNKVVVL